MDKSDLQVGMKVKYEDIMNIRDAYIIMGDLSKNSASVEETEGFILYVGDTMPDYAREIMDGHNEIITVYNEKWR